MRFTHICGASHVQSFWGRVEGMAVQALVNLAETERTHFNNRMLIK